MSDDTTTTLTPSNHIYPDPDFVSKGVGELPYFLQDKSNYIKLATWYCNRWNKMDGEMIKLAYLRLLDNASGKLIDMLGERIGLLRYDQTDLEYKAMIKLRSFRQTKGDTRGDILELFQILFFGEHPIITKGYNNFIEAIIPASCLSSKDLSKQLEDMFPINTNLWVTQTDTTPFYFVDLKDGVQLEGTGGFSDLKEAAPESLLTDWIHSSGRSIKNT